MFITLFQILADRQQAGRVSPDNIISILAAHYQAKKLTNDQQAGGASPDNTISILTVQHQAKKLINDQAQGNDLANSKLYFSIFYVVYLKYYLK